MISKPHTVCHDYPFTRGSSQAEETVHTLLLSEVTLADEHLGRAWEAETPAEVEASLGLAEKIIEGVDKIDLPGEVRVFWAGARKTLSQRVGELRAK